MKGKAAQEVLATAPMVPFEAELPVRPGGGKVWPVESETGGERMPIL